MLSQPARQVHAGAVVLPDIVMRRQGFAILVVITAIVVWRVGHGGAALALLLLVLSLQMSAYVRDLRPPRPGLWPRRHSD